ncbi:MAG: PrsW family intramembrane metalloprotease, partial [Clostridia bacterium]|nr:PrsW family intramembrane metalloprotease [Clostridia bacterium]
FLLMSLCCSLFDNANAYPGAMLFGSFMMPVAAMIFCFELNTPRNISFYTLMKVFMVGGAASLLLTCLLYEIVDVGELNFWGACLVSLVEETAKVAIVAYYLYREKDAKYYVNGLLRVLSW